MTASLTSKSEGDDCLYAWLGTALFLDIRGRAARPVIRRASARVGEGWSVLGAAVASRQPRFRFIRGGVRRLIIQRLGLVAGVLAEVGCQAGTAVHMPPCGVRRVPFW